MKKVFSGIVTHDGTASATIYVVAKNKEDAAKEVIAAACNGLGDFEWNEGNYIHEHYLGGSDNDIEEIGEINPINSLEQWMSLRPHDLVYWPTNGDQPLTRQEFDQLCHNIPDWAYKLYRHCVDSGGAYHPATFIDADGCVENLLFGNETNFMKLKRLLSASSLVTVDDSPYLHDWDVFDEDDCETDSSGNSCVLSFRWKTREYEYEVSCSAETIAAGEWKEDGTFCCQGNDGTETEISFFSLKKLS